MPSNSINKVCSLIMVLMTRSIAFHLEKSVSSTTNELKAFPSALSNPFTRITASSRMDNNNRSRMKPSIPNYIPNEEQALYTEIGQYALGYPDTSFLKDSAIPYTQQQATTSIAQVEVPTSISTSTAASITSEPVLNKGGNVLAARFVSWILKRIVHAKTTYATGLEVKVKAQSNRHLFAGRISTVEMKFDSLAFGQFFISGGGNLMVEGLCLKMKSFLFDNLNSLRKPYLIHGDVQLTQEDIVNSKFIRGLIQLLMDTILQRALKTPSNNGVLEINIQRVTIRDRRLNVFGETNIPSTGTRVPFEVSTGAGVRDNGQVVFLRDIQVVLNPNSYLKSPPIPVILNSEVTVDLGDDCSVQSLVITNKKVWIKASSKISPVAPFAVADLESKATYRYDLAALLSSILRMPRGILRFFR